MGELFSFRSVEPKRSGHVNLEMPRCSKEFPEKGAPKKTVWTQKHLLRCRMNLPQNPTNKSCLPLPLTTRTRRKERRVSLKDPTKEEEIRRPCPPPPPVGRPLRRSLIPEAPTPAARYARSSRRRPRTSCRPRGRLTRWVHGSVHFLRNGNGTQAFLSRNPPFLGVFKMEPKPSLVVFGGYERQTQRFRGAHFQKDRPK